MAGKIYALLVGIDKYQAPVSELHGCVADIEAMHTFLVSRVVADGYQLDAVVLKNAQAKRQIVIENFQKHLGQAGPDDVALFYYSGHGSQAQTAPEFYHLEPDRLDETVVCYDSRMPGNFDLADKEIASLIAEVAKQNPHIVLILDSCHSGSATRNIKSTGVRRTSIDNRQRPMSSYLVTPAEFASLVSLRSVSQVKNGWTQLPHGRHLVLSACQSDEEAREINIAGQTRGVFSYYLLESLQSTSGKWSYRDLFARVNSLVRTKVSGQSPLIEATNFEDLSRPFLGGAIQAHAPYFTVSFDNSNGWMIDGGMIHGIPAKQGDETTCLALFAVNTDDLENLSNAIGEARVLESQATRSTVAITLFNNRSPDKQLTYKSVITALPVPALRVRIEGNKVASGLIQKAMSTAGPNDTPTLLLREVKAGEELCLVAHDESFQIKRAGDDRPLSAMIDGCTIEKARDAVAYLEHIARWMHMANLSNPSSHLPPHAVSMDIYLIESDGSQTCVDLARDGTDLTLYYEYRDNSWHQPAFKLKLTNTSERRLYCMLFDLTDRFKIWAEDLLPGGGVWLDPAQETWAYSGDPIPASVPDELWQQGMTEYKDLLKVIASTQACDASRFQQGNIDVKYELLTSRGLGALNSLEQLMRHSQIRDIGERPKVENTFVDWVATELNITTVRPLESMPITSPGNSISLTSRLTLTGHAGLKANVRLTTVPLATRDLIQQHPLPPWLRDEPAYVQAFELSPSRSVEAGLSVLEFTEVLNHSAVTPEQPLILRVDANLKPEEHLLPVAYDPESDLYIPLGRAANIDGRIEIQLERLPAPSTGKRSLTGSIKIFFHKVIYETFGYTYKYPMLGAIATSVEYTADNSGDYKRDYISDINEVRNRVLQAERILLYVHGIIGDTQEMVASAFHSQPGSSNNPLAAHYDLVLSFDYENLNTTIEDNARALKQRLEQIGLDINHSKTLHIAAHSMGGLVSRWFIEYEGGNKVVQHLVMLGTPNGGSPWPTVEEWVTGAIGLGLNNLTTVAWPVKVLCALMKKFERAATTSLKQMEAESPLLQDLAASPDPRVRYTTIAGNTSLIADVLRLNQGENSSRLKRLFLKLNLQNVLHTTASLAFFGQPNDVAAGVISISDVPRFELLDPPLEVACDHMTYFSTEAGLQALSNALIYKE